MKNERLEEMLSDDLLTEQAPPETELERVVKLGNLLVEQQSIVADLEMKLKDAKDAMGRTEREDLPLLMQEIGLEQFKLADGSVVELVEQIQCGITEARRASAHAWLIENSFGGLIKTEVVVPFERGAHQAAMELVDELEEQDIENVSVKETVHPQTLKSFVKEQLEKGAEGFPLDLFGVFSFNVVKVSLPKKGRK